MPSSPKLIGSLLSSACLLTGLLLWTGLRNAPHAGPHQIVTDIRWYSHEAPNKTTANGEVFNPEAFSYASKIDQFGTVIDIKYEGHEVYAYCNDRGPARVELSEAAFAALAPLEAGVLRNVLVTYIQPENDNEHIAQARIDREAGKSSR